MRTCMFPCNLSKYDILGSFLKNGFVDYGTKFDLNVGDEVYIYTGAPYSAIFLKCSVRAILNYDETINDEEFLFDNEDSTDIARKPRYVRLVPIKNYLNKIDKVNASIELDGNTEDFTQDVNLTIIDKNQEVLTDSEMNSLRIENNAKVTVTAKLWKIRQGVQISADYVGTPAEGYQVGAVRTVPDTISVAGSAEGLESLADNNNVITIPEDSIDISGESEDVEKKISLTNLLPLVSVRTTILLKN